MTADHHAYLLLGDQMESLKKVIRFIRENLQFDPLANPDFWRLETETFGIEESRALKEAHSRKPLSGRRVFLVKARFFTPEAQNALLKILEEPAGGNYFFFLLPEADLLPTLLSRFSLWQFRRVKSEDGLSAEFFLSLSPPARLKKLSKIIQEQDKGLALEFLDRLTEQIYERRPAALKKSALVFEELRKAKERLNGPAPAIKIILEHLALILPLRAGR